MAGYIRTFLDSGVLITAFNGQRDSMERALSVLEDPGRIFLSSPFIQHEICPKARFNRRQAEYRFYREYFRRAQGFDDVRLILERGSRESARSGVGAMDALHLAAAHLLKADEFVTTEKPSRSIYRSSLLKIVYLFG